MSNEKRLPSCLGMFRVYSGLYSTITWGLINHCNDAGCLLNNQFDGKYEVFFSVAQLYFGLSPFPEIVTTRIITCLGSGIIFKLLLYWDWEVGPPNYIIYYVHDFYLKNAVRRTFVGR